MPLIAVNKELAKATGADTAGITVRTLPSVFSFWHSGSQLHRRRPTSCANDRFPHRRWQSPLPAACDWQLTGPTVCAAVAFHSRAAAGAVRATPRDGSYRNPQLNVRYFQASGHSLPVPPSLPDPLPWPAHRAVQHAIVRRVAPRATDVPNRPGNAATLPSALA